MKKTLKLIAVAALGAACLTGCPKDGKTAKTKKTAKTAAKTDAKTDAKTAKTEKKTG